MDFITLLAAALANPQLIYLVILVGAVLWLGIAAALSKGQFKLANVADVLERQLLPVLLIYLTLAILAAVSPPWGILRDSGFALLCARLIASIAQSLAALGIPIPAALSQYWATPAAVKFLAGPGAAPKVTPWPTQ